MNKSPLNVPQGFIGKDEAATVLGCTRRTIDNWMRRKLIPHYKMGYRVFFKRADLIAAVEACRVPASQQTPS